MYEQVIKGERMVFFLTKEQEKLWRKSKRKTVLLIFLIFGFHDRKSKLNLAFHWWHFTLT